jgi:hypothetical protein
MGPGEAVWKHVLLWGSEVSEVSDVNGAVPGEVPALAA